MPTNARSDVAYCVRLSSLPERKSDLVFYLFFIKLRTNIKINTRQFNIRIYIGYMHLRNQQRQRESNSKA